LLSVNSIFGWALGLLCSTCAQAQVITTVAGTNIRFPSQAISALNAPLRQVRGISADTKGNVFAVDPMNNVVAQIATDGTLTVVAGNGIAGFSGDGGAAVNASLNFPNGVAVDAAGNLYIADTFNYRIRKVSNGIITTIAGNGTGGFSGDGGPAINASLQTPYGLTVDGAGNIYIADTYNYRVRKITAGVINTIVGNGVAGYSGDGGSATSASLYQPLSVAVDSAGTLYIGAVSTGVRKVTGGIITTVPIPAGFGQAVAVDPAGALYVASGTQILKVSSGKTVTVAGNGSSGSLGDGAPAISASLSEAYGVTVDSVGNLYIADTFNQRVRKVNSSGIITTVAKGGQTGDGEPANSSFLFQPWGVAVDSSGNLFIADSGNNRVRKVSGGIITTVAGNGNAGFSGDAGLAVNATLNGPRDVAVDGAGNLYIADSSNARVRKVSGGVITTVAGGNFAGDLGDGGPATSASINPESIALDAANNLYISDIANSRIRKVSAGIITTIAGNGTPGYSGDGGPATAASIDPIIGGIAVDSAGNVFVADSMNNRIRQVSGGMITTVAGNGAGGFSGDGGPATNASLDYPSSVRVDAAGNIYIGDYLNSRIRRVTNGTITSVAGGGTGGDGGPALGASFAVFGLAVDASGDIFIGDVVNNRVREVLNAVSYRVTPPNLTFTAAGGDPVLLNQTISLSSAISGLAFTASTNAPWLTVNPTSGTIPAQVRVSVDASTLSESIYQSAITIAVSGATPATTTIPVTVNLASQAPTPIISANPANINFSFTQGASASTAQLTISTAAPGPFSFAATASTSTGGNWLQVSAGNGSVTAGSPTSLIVSAIPGSLTVGTYSGSISVSSPNTGQTFTVPVAMAISAPPQKIVLSQLGFTFTAVAQGGTVLPQALGILNTGAGTLNWTATASTLPPASGWLSLSASSGTVNRPFLDVSYTNVIVSAGSLSPGDYYGQIQVSAVGASNSPQTALVVLRVLPPGSNPGPDVRPTGLTFTSVSGGQNPGSQTVTVGNLTANPITFGSAVAYVGGASWIEYLPTDATIFPSAPAQVVVQPDFTSLGAGVRRAALTLAFDDGSIQTISILSVLAPPGAALAERSGVNGRAASGCSPAKLLPQFTQVGFGSKGTVPVGYPAAIAAYIVDDCGNPMTSGSVVVSFSNGDPPLSLLSLQDGNWTASWQPLNASANVTLTLNASQPDLGLVGSRQSDPLSAQQGSQSPPILSAAPQGVGTLTGGAFAPGDLILLQGSSLADGQARSVATPLKQQLAGASVVVGGRILPLLYADPYQVVGLIPLDVPVNTSQQVILLRDNVVGLPTPLIIATTHPAILTKDGSGLGQGLIYKANGATTTLADVNNPVQAGDTVVIYCTGLGLTDTSGNASNPVAVSFGGLPARVTYAGVALAQSYPPGGAPTLLSLVSASLGGLYQVGATVPAGASGSAVSISLSSAGQISQSGVTLAVVGPGGGTTPTISSIVTAGGFGDIAENDWIQISGSNLAPPSVGQNGMTWDNAPDFVSGRMPTQLGGVSVTVNGKPAFVYFVSASQVNALTPLDGTLGPVQVVITSAGVASPPFTANMRNAAPSFPLFGATNYIVATHSDYSLLGPTSLSSPGYSFSPAKPGETILIYAFGFGLPSTQLVNGASSQVGPLPALPGIQIGGLSATVAAANVISPGLYQFNVVVPSAPDGDNAVTCIYAGQSSPAGEMLTIQR
jgi:trimeric autotransporter adhesin